MLINRLVLHCSDSPQGRGDGAATIHRWHQEKGWKAIGYHYVIQEDGTVEAGRPHWWEGAHAIGYNEHSLGICLIGEGQYTEQQLRALRQLIDRLLDEYPAAEIDEHRYLNPDKGCPLFNKDIQTNLKNLYGSRFFCQEQID